MGLIKIVSDTPDDLFKARVFPVLPAGRHLFVVSNKPEVDNVSDPDSTNQIIKLEMKCQDEDENKGMAVFDNFLIVSDVSTDKQKTTKNINDAKLAQFVVACGLKTMEEIKAGQDFDLSDLEGKIFSANSVVSMEDIYPQELDPNGKPKKAPRARIRQYLFEPSESNGSEPNGSKPNPEISS